MAKVRYEDKIVLEANTVYLLMKKGFPISRNVRAQWILEHLDAIVDIQHKVIDNDEASELEIVSILPSIEPPNWSADTSHQFLYKITANTSTIFLAHRYRMVFNLDLSPSLATVDIQYSGIVIEEVCLATKQCLQNITKPFLAPGSNRLLKPEVYVTVIAHSPFFTNPAQQVLVQGWLVTTENVDRLVMYIEKQLIILEEKVANVTAVANHELEMLKAESGRLVGGLFEEGGVNLSKSNGNSITNMPIVSPEASFINMLRYGMLALTLLPEHSCAHLIVVTDGVVGVTGVHVLDSVIQQLRATTVACSVLHVGSAYHPHCGDGLVPHQDLLCFLASATLGSYMTFFSNLEQIPTYDTSMNTYHKQFLCWQMYRELSYSGTMNELNSWKSENSLFDGRKPVQLLRKKQIDDKVTCTLSSLLCCRLREGYLIKRASIHDDNLELCFILEWKTNVFLEYLVTCPWSLKLLSTSNTIQYTITIEAPYEFLHDMTCLSKKPLKSIYRQHVVSRFWAALTSLTESDSMLAHFSWFPGSGWTWYSVPDTVRSGMPVFYLSAYPSPNAVQLSDAACPQFGQIWQPVVSLDPLQWSRWMHTQRVTLILSHDRPLPRHLHQANPSGRFQCVQSRQAAAVLYAMLKTWATFVLVENHTYVQFIYREAEKPPVSFSLIRINCKALSVVLNIAFAGGTEGVVRHNVVIDLVERLSKLTLPNRPTEQRETPCCIIIHKSLERILIRYERMPSDLSMIIFPDGTQPVPTKSSSIPGSSVTTTLSRYLYHNRWLWHVKRPLVHTIPGITLPRLNITAIARILSTITKMRLMEGFSFAYSAAGIINMVLEVQMQGDGDCAYAYPCIIQYILFPPHVIANAPLERESASDEDTDEGTADGEISTEDCESNGDFQIVTEIWIEPQCGYVQAPQQRTASYMNNLQYHQLAETISRIDGECINALLTLEHLSLLSQVEPPEKNTEIDLGQPCQIGKVIDGTNGTKITDRPRTTEFLEGPSALDERIHLMRFSFDVLSVLPKCQQAELLYSMFSNDSDYHDDERDNPNKILMEGFLEHMKLLHNKELLLTSAESQRFTEMLFSRPREVESTLPLFSKNGKNLTNNKHNNNYPSWRCYIKGISTTHVIITIVPASERDVHLIMYPKERRSSSSSYDSHRNDDLDNCTNDIFDKTTSVFSYVNELNVSDSLFVENESTKFSSQSTITHTSPNKHTLSDLNSTDAKKSLIIPIYVYDCSLALLTDTLVNKLQSPRSKDIYQNYTFRTGQSEDEEFVDLKTNISSKPGSPEPLSEDSDNISIDQKSLTEHCKLISLAHCHCYVVAVYKSLIRQQSLSFEDMEAAVEQCEETVIEINITKYLRTVCRHLSTSSENAVLNDLKTSACNDVKPLHNLIKNKFEEIMNTAFKPVPAHPEFYYCYSPWTVDRMELAESDSDDELEDYTFHSENIEAKLDFSILGNQITNTTWPTISHHALGKLSDCISTESHISDLREENNYRKDEPLFLQLSCSIHSSLGLCTVPVKLLPTCFREIIDKMEDLKNKNFNLNSSNLKVTLDIICLNLPRDVLEVSLERCAGLRSTSFCSNSPHGSIHTESESSPGNEIRNEPIQDKMSHLPIFQHNAIDNLTDEIEWLLQNETTTALLDKLIPTEEILQFVANHVHTSDSTGRSCCCEEKVPLHFVFSSESSEPRFLQELKKLQIDKYCIRQEGSLFYVSKTTNKNDLETLLDIKNIEEIESDIKEDIDEHEIINIRVQSTEQDTNYWIGCHSEASSINEGKLGTDDGYEGDNSNCEDDFHWLHKLDERRNLLPNFWLILKVETNFVYIYFHCRFLKLPSPEVDRYRQVQKLVVNQIKAICRKVNQYLLLQSLHDTRVCDPLLESESSEDVWKFDGNNESTGNLQNQNTAVHLTPGMFRCRVVWEVPFCLHPRLKTGPGRSNLSRGIKALHGVLNRFSVNNRSNMFVYQENNENVFYLRLHEQTNDGKSLQNKLSESDEKLVVSRSSSVASLSQTKSAGLMNDHTIMADTRPRVRSFGEKESDSLNKLGDSIVLMVHGISEAGDSVKRDLVQVLQNRLDDAVLEVLSVMLARNPMCKLTPADVHFIQKPYRSPETIVRLSVQPHCLPYIGALGYYLRQNLLQFLYTPKYTDHRAHYHFQDYSQPEGSAKRISETDIFLYNQSHSSGSKGIACIASAIVNLRGEPIMTIKDVSETESSVNFLNDADFENIVSTTIYENKEDAIQLSKNTEAFIEFRIWKQGRVNLESLNQKLRAAVKHAIWDLITEYKLLSTPLTESFEYKDDDTAYLKQATNYKCSTKLHQIYQTTLARWFKFALEIGVPAVKKHEILIPHRHSVSLTVKELQNLIRALAPHTDNQIFTLRDKQPFLEVVVDANTIDHDNIENIKIELPFKAREEKIFKSIYVPSELNKEDHGVCTKCILIVKNFDLYKSPNSDLVDQEMAAKDHKLAQKFNPFISDINFVPRQRILLAQIQSNQIILYMYNWSKEKSEKLIKQSTNLGTWLSSRSSLFTNIIMQKLGIFHHQLLQCYHLREQNNVQYYQITDMESLTKFPFVYHGDNKDWPRSTNRIQTIKNNSFSWNQLIGQAIRDSKPNISHNATISDPVVRAGFDLQDLRHREKKTKEELSRLYAMWQNRSANPNIPIPQTTLNTFKQHARLFHFCHTPLLFLPAWRLQSAATRDHSLTPPSSLTSSGIAQQFGLQINFKTDIQNKEMIKWHQELCNLMFSEYKQYLQTLGFHSIQIDSTQKIEEECVQHQSYYLKKSMLGGVLLFEIQLSEPFFMVKLHIIECRRLQAKTSSALANQFVLSFVDACDKIKINMHLHSFTYDFHLRCIHSYIAGTGAWSLQQGYHLIHFLDDFNKYYSKAPNYARNLIYSDVITINDLVTPARTLYSYLLLHEKTYGMHVFVMSSETDDVQDSEDVLVRLQSTPLVSYYDDAKYTDDFDVALIVSRLKQLPQLEKNEITLKFYLMLTSKRELYPKKEVENSKLGKFRTVYSIVKPTSSYAESSTESSPIYPNLTIRRSSKADLITTEEQYYDNLETNLSIRDAVDVKPSNNNNISLAPIPPPVPNSPLTQNSSMMNTSGNSSPRLIQIRQESINYLGYYSSHEQLMQQMIMTQAEKARQHIKHMIERGASQCRTHLLWNKLLENKSSMVYLEFMELCTLSHIEPLSKLDKRLSPFVNQQLSWYQSLSKVLQSKYQEQHKQFNTPDGNITHHLILHPRFIQAFMMLTIDLHTSRGELCAVYRKHSEFSNTQHSMDDIYDLIEGFVNACCFHLWVGLCTQ